MPSELISIIIPTIGRPTHKPNMVMENFVTIVFNGIRRKKKYKILDCEGSVNRV